MIEFEEFLSIIKGGSAASKEGKDKKKDDPTTAIFDFFSALTDGKMKDKENEHMPFSLFVSYKRR